MHAFANAGYRIVSIDTARLDNRPEYGMLIHMEFVPAPFNIGRTSCQIQTGWSPRSERRFER
jgi:hypothetical protein